jgi:TolB-like protein/DNA-binding winged helix-turn-helix (wHTH) protein
MRFKSGPFEVYSETGEVTRDGTQLKLRPQAFKVLCILMERPGELVTREELAKQLWGEDTFVDFDQGLNFCVREVRKHLGDGAEEPKYIETLPRRGYRFIAPVERIEGAAKAGKVVEGAAVAESAAVATEPAEKIPETKKVETRERRWPKWLAPVAIGVFCALVVGAVWLYSKGRTTRRYPARIVVLPFANLTGNDKQEYLVRGMVEEITAQLGSIEPVALAVIGRTSAEAVANHGLRVDQISTELDVDYVVEGSVRQQGNRLRITAQLIRSSDMAHVWAESYERDAMQLFTVEQQVAASIVREINYALGREAKPMMAKRTSDDAEAMDIFLQGKYAAGRYTRTINGTAYEEGYHEAYAQAETLLRRAIELDPKFALAHAELGMLLAARTKRDDTPDPDWSGAEQNALQALQFEPSLLETHLLLASIALLRDGNLAEAKRSLDRANELSPHDSQYLRALGTWEIAAGNSSEAVKVAETLVLMEPMDDSAQLALSTAFYFDGQYDKTLQMTEAFLRKHPDSTGALMYLSHAYYLKGDQRGWMQVYLRTRELVARVTPGAEDGAELQRAKQVFESGGPYALLTYVRGPGRQRFLLAPDRGLPFRYLLIGEKENAIKALEELANQERYLRSLRRIVMEPMLKQLKGDARFDAIVQKATAQ